MKKVPYERSLAYCNPDLAKEWHPTKNGTLKPSEVWKSERKKVWWLLPYDDEITGRHFDFEWQETIENRVRGYKCPYLTGKRVWKGFNDLQTLMPDIAKEWYPTKNGNLTPSDVTIHSGKYVWWYLPYDDPITGKHFDFEWYVKVNNRTRGYECPYISGKKVWKGYNDLATVRADLAKEWHPSKNGNLMPSDVTAHSGEKVWWYMPYDDPITGKHFDFEWEATIASRESGNGCPFISKKAVWIGYNDLASQRPDLFREVHPTKNKGIDIDKISQCSNKKIWWYMPYDDPITGKHFDFEWEEKVSNRVINCNCPYLSGHKVYQGYNDLVTIRPDLAKQWHPSKNGNLKPSDITAYSNKKIWWYMPYDDPASGKHFEFEWCTSVVSRKKHDCPYLDGQKAWPGYNDLLTICPEIVVEWHPSKNGNLKPSDITAYSNKKIWWYMPYDEPITGKHFDFEWQATPHSRVGGGTSCPYLTGNGVWSGYNDLQTLNPELASEWDYKKNHNTPDKVRQNSNKKVWWNCLKCGHNWRASIANRSNGRGCPQCNK